MRKITLLALFLLITTVLPQAHAKTGEYIIEVEAGKKVLNVQQLDLSPTTRLSELLELFPELLSRGTVVKYQNYDLKVDDVSTGDSKGIILEQLKLSDIEFIEVSQTPSASQQNNGQGGVIKVRLKKLEEGFSGEAFMGAGTGITVTPGTRLNYSKGPWSVRGTVLTNYMHPRNQYSSKEMIHEETVRYQKDTASIDNAYEMVNIDVMYTPDQHNKLHIWGWENYSFNSNYSNMEVEINSMSNNEAFLHKESYFKWLAGAKYTHTFDKSALEAECSFENGPGSCTYDKYLLIGDRSINYLKYSEGRSLSKLMSYVKYKYNFVPVTPKSKALLTGGINVNLTNNGLEYDYNNLIPQYGLHGNSSILYLSPFIETDNVFGKWFLKASFRYMHYSHDMTAQEGSPHSRQEDYFTGFVNAGYQIAPHHHLSLILDRSIRRGDAFQLYPYKIYDSTKELFTIGNASLNPVLTHSVALNYITDFTVNDNKLTFDLELKYLNNKDIIAYSWIGNDTLEYTNNGEGNIGVVNLLFHYSSKIFSLSFTGNLYNNNLNFAKSDNHFTYYNLSVVPSLNFNGGWVVSAQLAYNSRMSSNTTKLGDYFYANTRFSKIWDKWVVYLELDDNFHKQAEDILIVKGINQIYRHNLHTPSLSVGFQFKF